MVAKVKFPLEMENGKKVRNLEELKENFNLRKIVEHYLDGKLQRWLGANYYDELLEQVEDLNKADPDLARKLAGIFDVKSEESKSFNVNSLERSVKLKEELRECGESKEALENVEVVADTQERLDILVRCGKQTIYLFKGEFCVKKEFRNLKLIGIGRPTVELEAKSQEEFLKQNVELSNVNYKHMEKKETKKQSLKIQKSWYDNPLDDFMKSWSEDNLDSMSDLNNTPAEEEEDQKYYFMLRKQKERYIVSVNINNWKVEIVKELGEVQIDRFGLAYDTFVWRLEDNDKVIFWENFRTKKSGKFLLDFGIANTDRGFLVIEDGILVENWKGFDREIVKLGFDKSVRTVKAVGGDCCYLDGGNKIYCMRVSYDDGSIYSISKNLDGEFKEECQYDSSYVRVDSVQQHESVTFCEAGIDNGEPFGYTFYEKFVNRSLLNVKTTRVTEKFTLKGFERKYGHQAKKIEGSSLISDFLVKDFTTENYQLLGNYIYTKDHGEDLNEVCRFDRMLNSNQGVSIFSRDIFIGIIYLDESDETAIIKIDMQNEREAVILPLKI